MRYVLIVRDDMGDAVTASGYATYGAADSVGEELTEYRRGYTYEVLRLSDTPVDDVEAWA